MPPRRKLSKAAIVAAVWGVLLIPVAVFALDMPTALSDALSVLDQVAVTVLHTFETPIDDSATVGDLVAIDVLHTFQAPFSDAAAVGDQVTVSFVLSSTTTTLSSNLNPSTYGTPVTYTATVTASDSNPGTGAGTVAFNDGTALLCGAVPLSGNLATCTTTPLAGSHSMTASYSGTSRYTASSGGLVQQVDPATLTVTADDASKIYGAPNPTFTVHYSGLVNGDTAASLGGTVTLTAPGPASPAGTYTGQIVAAGLTSSNYQISYVNGTLTVTPAPLTITVNDATRYYGQPNPSFSITTSGLVNGDPVTSLGVPVYSTAATQMSAVGDYPITVSGLSNPNYASTYVAGTLHVLDTPPTADSGGAYSGVEGAAIAFTGKAADVDGSAVVSLWSVASNTGDDSGAACLFANAAALSTSLTCNDEGSYTLTLTATDSAGLMATSSTTVTVSNAAPVVGSISGLPTGPVAINSVVSSSVSFIDPGTLDPHTAVWSWGDGSSSAGAVTEIHGAGSVTGSHTYTVAGVYTVTVTATDADGAIGSAMFEFVVVYDPSAGFVTGSGWITSPVGADALNPTATGKASFGFVSNYQKGAAIPSGNTQFQFQAASLNFHSAAYQWLVISGSCRAQFKGTGTINGSGSYTFLLTAVDGERCANPGPDTFRIQITDNAFGATVYDNGTDQAIGGGDIQVHS